MPFGLDLMTILLGVGALIVAAVLIGLLVGLVDGPKDRRNRDDLQAQRLASHNWASLKAVKELRVERDDTDPRRLRLCMLAGKQLANPPLRSKLVLAPSGAGKTPRVVIPDVLLHHGPAVVASIKGDVLALTRQHRSTLGEVWVFDPSEVVGPSARWSPIAHITSWAEALDAARWIQESSKADGAGGVQDRDFWDAQARFLLAPLLFLAARRNKTIGDVAELVTGGEDTEHLVAKELATTGEPGPSTYWARFTGLEHRTKSSVLVTAATVLEAWTHPRVAAAVNVLAGEAGVLDPDKLLDGGAHTLYLVAPASEQSMFTPIYETLVNAITMRVERAAQARGGIALDPPLLLEIDEAANIAPLRNLDKLASRGAGEGIIVVSVWQDEGQIETIYGPAKARTILANHFSKVYLAGIQDHQTLVNLSQQIGRDPMRQTSTTTGEKSRSSTTSFHELDVAPPSWIRQMDADQAIVIAGRFPSILGSIPGWFESTEMRALIPADVAAAFDSFHGTPKGRKRHRRPTKTTQTRIVTTPKSDLLAEQPRSNTLGTEDESARDHYAADLRSRQ